MNQLDPLKGFKIVIGPGEKALKGFFFFFGNKVIKFCRYICMLCARCNEDIP